MTAGCLIIDVSTGVTFPLFHFVTIYYNSESRDIKASSDRAIFPFETSLKSFDLSLLAVLQACKFLWAFNLNVKNAQNFIS
jgi:hypothetical protein